MGLVGLWWETGRGGQRRTSLILLSSHQALRAARESCAAKSLIDTHTVQVQSRSCSKIQWWQLNITNLIKRL